MDMSTALRNELRGEIDAMRDAGLYKNERVITTRQGAVIRINDGREVLNFCANNYLGLTSNPLIIEAARSALERWGYGLSSVRFICGTQEIHKEAEKTVARFLGMDDAILFSSCFDANLGVFQTLLTGEDAIIADQLNHASIIDGVRLSKASRHVYAHSDMDDLAAKLRDAAGARRRLVVTDGVFSMDGEIARLPEICDLASEHEALLMVDDSHATGVIGATGRGTPEHTGCEGRVDLITTTFGKALGGASGGCVVGDAVTVEYLRQRSRPYLFSNTVAPAVLGATIAALDQLSGSSELLDRLRENTEFFRREMAAAGFDIVAGSHPIVPVMFGRYDHDARLAEEFATELLDEGIYVIGFSYPVVPKGTARIRVQVSAAHDRKMLERAVAAFVAVGQRKGVLARGA